MTSLKFAFQACRILFVPALLVTSAVSLIATSAGGLTVPETPPSSWNQGSFGVQTTSEYFISRANYSETRGSWQSLPNDNKWNSFENTLKLRYGFTPAISLYGGATADGVTATDNAAASPNKTNSNIDIAFAGADFLLARRWWRVVPEIEGGYSLNDFKRGQTTPLTSDGAPFVNLGMFMFKPYRYLRFEAYTGFHLPGIDLAKTFNYRFGAEIAMLGAFTLGGGVQGYETVLSDATTNFDRKITQTSADATSARFWAYNPALLEVNGWIGLRFDRSFGVRLGYAKTLNGVRAAEGQSILLSLYYNSRGNGPGPMPKRISTPRVSVGPKEFRTVPEPTDPELFEQTNESLDSTERLFDHK